MPRPSPTVGQARPETKTEAQIDITAGITDHGDTNSQIFTVGIFGQNVLQFTVYRYMRTSAWCSDRIKPSGGKEIPTNTWCTKLDRGRNRTYTTGQKYRQVARESKARRCQIPLVANQLGHSLREHHGKGDTRHQDPSRQASKTLHHVSPSVGTSRCERPDCQSESDDGEHHGIPLR